MGKSSIKSVEQGIAVKIIIFRKKNNYGKTRYKSIIG